MIIQNTIRIQGTFSAVLSSYFGKRRCIFGTSCRNAVESVVFSIWLVSAISFCHWGLISTNSLLYFQAVWWVFFLVEVPARTSQLSNFTENENRWNIGFTEDESRTRNCIKWNSWRKYFRSATFCYDIYQEKSAWRGNVLFIVLCKVVKLLFEIGCEIGFWYFFWYKWNK